MKIKAVNFIFGADMRGNHNMLRVQSKKYGVDLENLTQGEVVVFINRAKDKLKTYAFNHVVSYVRCEDVNRVFDMGMLNFIPQAFDASGKLEINKAIEARVKELVFQKKKLRTPLMVTAK